MVGSIGMGKAIDKETPPLKPSIKLIIKFFSRRSDCTEPRGICLAGMEYIYRKGNDLSLTTCDAIYEFNTLTIEVPKASMTESARRTLVGFYSLPVDADLTLSSETSKTLGAMGLITIKSGDYPIKEEIDKYIITIPCK